jgi:hypothetical protein
MNKKKARIATITSNMKGCLRFDTLMFPVSPNLAKIDLIIIIIINTAAQWPTDHGSVG